MKDFLVMCGVFVAILAVIVGGVWYATLPKVYDFGSGAQLVVPSGTVCVDRRKDGLGIAVQSDANVTVVNGSDEWRSLTVSFKTDESGVLSHHAFEDLPPKSSKKFGADSAQYRGMFVSVSDYAQKKRDKADK